MNPAWSYLASGVVLGAGAGLSPGPMSALVMAQTLRFGSREGVKVSLAPLVSDTPIVLGSLLVLASLASFTPLVGAVALCGAAFLVYLGAKTWAAPRPEAGGAGPSSLANAVAVNLFSPNPYLFWITVGAPYLVSGARLGWTFPALFLIGFYALLVGCKMAMALALGRFRHFLVSRAYVWIMRGLGAAMFAMAAGFAVKGLGLLGVVPGHGSV